MLKNKKIIIICGIIFVLILTSVPLVLERIIFRNAINSNLSSSEFLSFLGSYSGNILGSIIAGFVTLLGIKYTINHNQIEARIDRENNIIRDEEDQRRNVLPYLQIIVERQGNIKETEAFALDNNSTNYKTSAWMPFVITFKNVGRDSAVNIRNVQKTWNSNELKNMLYKNRSLEKNEKSCEIQIYANLKKEIIEENENQEYNIKIIFEDLLGYTYEQTFILYFLSFEESYKKHYYFSKPPILIEVRNGLTPLKLTVSNS
ncbi:hypothetical protein D2A34_13690 [Clostridium chromiireducens]|uniref:Uncharacterized protein n=1 Tax=Clostridium chromiireducens TaxID=225345 RepID=A0A399IM90_9CLOT|nr:hypothetical protein [Clostridium chromiireducens]RII34208.1 hypothetical protein D2A34_13690 [Clostridium chromiireducens]